MPEKENARKGGVEIIEELPLAPLAPGEMGAMMGGAGSGKTACLTHLAISYLLRGQPVLHICIDTAPDKAKLWYGEILKSLFADKPEFDISEVRHGIEPLRLIMSFMNQTFTPPKLERSIEDVEAQIGFKPSLLVIDGLDFDHAERSLFEQIRNGVRRHSAPVWFSVRVHRHISESNEWGIPYPLNRADDLFDSIVMLRPEPEGIKLDVLKQREIHRPASELLLDPHTFLLQKKRA